MPPTPSDLGSVRPSAVVNDLIRALVERCGGWLYGADRAEYEALVTERAAAVRAETGVAEAA